MPDDALPDRKLVALLFVRDLSKNNHDQFYVVEGGSLSVINVESLAVFNGLVVCHDFWAIRDTIFNETGTLPNSIVDLEEFRMSTSGDRDDRLLREKVDITAKLSEYGASTEDCINYRKMIFHGRTFDTKIGASIGAAMLSFFKSLKQVAIINGEIERYFEIEVPVYHILQKAMAKGIGLNANLISSYRKKAEFDYYFALKNFSHKHDMPLDTPSSTAIEAKLLKLGFDLSGVSSEYILEFLPHANNFGEDTLSLLEYDNARNVLTNLTVSTDRVHPIIDVFGSRTSRILLRSPSMQNMPKRYRNIIEASTDKELSYVDYDQYEVGIMAALSGDKQLKILYETGDMYALFADKHLGLEGNRKAAKKLFLSYAYGMKRQSLVDAAVSLGASRDKAKAAFNVFSVYEDWKKLVEKKLASEGRIGTEFGNFMRRVDKGQISAKKRRSAVSQVVQGTASLIFKEALISVADIQDVNIILPMHDALLFEHSSDKTPQEVVRRFEEVMTRRLNSRVLGKASTGDFAQP